MDILKMSKIGKSEKVLKNYNICDHKLKLASRDQKNNSKFVIVIFKYFIKKYI